jgi:hypothetical protein
MLSADELAGQGVSLLPALTPPSVNQGLVLNGTTQYARFSTAILPNMPYFASVIGELTLVFLFTPGFAPNDGLDHYFLDLDDGAGANRTLISHDASNELRVYSGATSIVMQPTVAVYGPWWSLNGSVFTTSAAAFTPQRVMRATLGASFALAQYFSGTFHNFAMFNRKLSQVEITDMWAAVRT